MTTEMTTEMTIMMHLGFDDIHDSRRVRICTVLFCFLHLLLYTSKDCLRLFSKKSIFVLFFYVCIVTDPCLYRPCIHGQCIPHPTVAILNYTCVCENGYTGDVCDIGKMVDV